MVALSLLSEQYEDSFLATKLCSQTTPLKNNPPEKKEAASKALLLVFVPWAHSIHSLSAECPTGQQVLVHGHGVMPALPCSLMAWIAWGVIMVPFAEG